MLIFPQKKIVALWAKKRKTNNKFMIHVFLGYSKYTQCQTTADLLE